MSTRFWLAVAVCLLAPVSYSEGEDELLELVRANAFEGFMEQASSTLPESFHNSGLAESDKMRLIEQWAKASASCLADSLAAYAETTDTPLSEMVNNDGSFSPAGDGSHADFNLSLETCIERAWAEVGAEQPR